jgi:branched-chain amino acid transport system permease protein
MHGSEGGETLSPQVIVNGLILGGLYATVGMGFSLVYGVMGIVNLASGAMIMLGAYVTYWLFLLFGVDPFLSIIPSMAMLMLLGYVMQRYVINRVMEGERRVTLILTYGFQLVFINSALVAFKGDYRLVNTSYAGRGLALGSLTIPYSRLAVVLLAVLSTLALHLFMTRTKLGNAITATALNRKGAQMCGVDINRIYAMTFGIGAALSAVAGTAASMVYTLTPYIGEALLGRAFIVTVLGGLGSFAGPLVGGLILGLAETVGSAFLGSNYQEAISFIILVLILAIRPQGIFGRRFFGGGGN